MPKIEANYVWYKQSMHPLCEVIDCPVYDPIKDWVRDPSGFYVLIRADYEQGRIEVAVCDKDHLIVRVFRGVSPQDLYEGIFRYEKKHGLTWFSDKGHAAYLGKEMKKAALAIASGRRDYCQE